MLIDLGNYVLSDRHTDKLYPRIFDQQNNQSVRTRGRVSYMLILGSEMKNFIAGPWSLFDPFKRIHICLASIEKEIFENTGCFLFTSVCMISTYDGEVFYVHPVFTSVLFRWVPVRIQKRIQYAILVQLYEWDLLVLSNVW